MDPRAWDLREWFGQLGFNEWVALISAALAILSFLFNWLVVRRQTAMQFEALRADRDSDLIDWADLVIEAMADAQKLCRDKDKLISPQDFALGQSETRTRLSALLDRGRLFFPNQEMDVEGGAAEAAYMGKRQPALDAIFGVYRIVSDVGRRDSAPEDPVRAIVAEKRTFVSEVFNTVDPRRRQAAMSDLDYARAKRRQKRAAKAQR